jgi:hypothetical protein
MFEGFKHVQLQTSDPQVTINLRYGGTGPVLLFLHGSPLTHVAGAATVDKWVDNVMQFTPAVRGPARLSPV